MNNIISSEQTPLNHSQDTAEISESPQQVQRTSELSTNVHVSIEENSNVQPARITKWTRSHP